MKPPHLLLLLLWMPAHSQSKSDLAGFLGAFRSRRDDAYEARIEAIKNLRGDSPEVAEALVDAYCLLEKQVLPIEKERYQLLERSRSGSVAELRRKLDPIRQAQRQVLDRLQQVSSRDALVWLLAHVVGDDDIPMTLKLVVTRSATRLRAEIVGPFGEALRGARDPDEIVALLKGLQQLGSDARHVGDDVVLLLDHASSSVRENAAFTLASLAVPQAIAPMVGRLDQEEGYSRLRLAMALEILTRQKLGESAETWKRWLADEGKLYASGSVPLGGGESSLGIVEDAGYFYGIPQTGHSIVYVIDASGSMIVSMSHPQFQGNRPVPAPPGEISREQVCKEELIKSLGELPEDALFNIVYYASEAKRFAPRMLPASAGQVKKAQKFVEEMQSWGATNIYDALESAFALSGRAASDRHYDPVVDTIFLLTDGEPSLPSGEKDSPERILDAARRWNALGRMVVHCIGLGEGDHTNNDFLRKLAQEHGGQFVLKQ